MAVKAGFFNSEDMLGVDVPADRRAWILSEDLFRSARRTTREPGSGELVVRRRDGRYRVLDGAEAVRTNTLATGTAIYGEFSACLLALWEDMVITINRLSQPGTILITLDRYYDFAVTRAARFLVLSPA